ncbi:MAG: DUF3261 domain-containing protein [Gammaproteobacteria bacterium]|nr:DUF3261 domain-containing protein [Gammaproteobacteria bacterium]
MNPAKLLTVLLLVFFAVACSSPAVRSQQQGIAIARGVNLFLPRADELTGSFNAIQAITAEYEDRSFSFEAHIEARPGKITIVALGPLGGALFSISYDGNELVASGSPQAISVDAEYVLADVLLAHWDVDWLNRRIEGAVVEVSQTGDERFVTRQDDLLIGISYESPNPWGGMATLTHLERLYTLHIRTAEFTPQ